LSNRTDALNGLGLNPDIVTPLIEQCYKNEEKQIFAEDLFSSPHGQHWSTSFHASQFPGDDETACPRKAMYGFMNIPGPEPASHKLRASAESGEDIEDRIVWRFHRAGILLSEPPSSQHQTNFQDKKHWLSGNSDAVIRVPRVNRPYAVEIKSKYQRVIDKMKMGEQSYDPQHKNQLMTYISLIHHYGQEYWPELEPCMGGSIIYVSRDDPSQIHEFKFTYDPDWWKEGLARLEEWQDYFKDEVLPPRPEGFMWSKGPCQYCNYKKYCCKPDDKAGITKMNESHGIEYANSVRKGGYDYQTTRQATLDRWMKENKEQSSE
jgi:CRISPR/Cas system-associated exonuclease Cas4 (RecB family)